MEFKRGRKADTDIMNRMQWESRCGSYRVSHCDLTYGSPYYLAECKLPATKAWWPVEWITNRKQHHSFRKHRTRAAAERVCAQHQQERGK